MARLEEEVVDASVALKWFVTEPDSDRALALLDDHLGGTRRILGPSLLPFEVGNALRYHPAFTLDGV